MRRPNGGFALARLAVTIASTRAVHSEEAAVSCPERDWPRQKPDVRFVKRDWAEV